MHHPCNVRNVLQLRSGAVAEREPNIRGGRLVKKKKLTSPDWSRFGTEEQPWGHDRIIEMGNRGLVSACSEPVACSLRSHM